MEKNKMKIKGNDARSKYSRTVRSVMKAFFNVVVDITPGVMTGSLYA